ncbi:hypothetical protein H6F77_09185 [Microcoleus sp. FACHB-831]|uniref:hypothetical protein n=1 Tax=Microcoleus sp. FACHB-831 TaxID=2692827 RepID=UPI0016877E44|nr:hypothetical protein [Microcoleus sp. FACHB-831]MBD1921263.1 hypothetical protein [Microcoleus sp. FACHB-831]
MLRKLTILLMSLTLCLGTVGCGGDPTPRQSVNQPSQNRTFNTTSSQNRLAEGQYPVQQATYDDGNGEYTLMLLDTPAGSPPVYRTTDLQMARLTDEEIKAGKKSFLNVNNGQAALHLTEDFKIEYVHNVTETRNDPQTGQPQTVVVRQQSNFWAPFAGALAGQAVGSLLFRPQYYVPPVYQPGGMMTGYGGYGSSYGQAVNRYQSRYQAPPPAVRNREVLRTTGRLRSPSYNNRPTTVRRVPSEGSRSTGSGYGSSTLRRSNRSTPTRTNRPSGFGSGGRSRAPSRSGGFGSRRR